MFEATGQTSVDHLGARSISDLAATKVDKPYRLERGRKERFEDHFVRLESEFGGRSELELLHAALIVLIRREMSLPEALGNFHRLWRSNPSTLCTTLDLRWLVAACDTFADHPQDEAQQLRATLASTLVNTVKLYESERRAVEAADITADLAKESRKDIPGLLFDGVTRFGIGVGDMVVTLIERLAAANRSPSDHVQLLTVEVINRVLRNDTVFRRFAALHTNPRTLWRPIDLK